MKLPEKEWIEYMAIDDKMHSIIFDSIYSNDNLNVNELDNKLEEKYRNLVQNVYDLIQEINQLEGFKNG